MLGIFKRAPQPERNGEGADDPGPRNLSRDRENPELLRSPATDHGNVPNLRFSFSDAHMRLENGGWSREVTQRELPIATSLAAVNMRLKPGAFRELHWHKQAEWSFMLHGCARITAVGQKYRISSSSRIPNLFCTRLLRIRASACTSRAVAPSSLMNRFPWNPATTIPPTRMPLAPTSSSR